jgi:hypothetical protein
MTTLLRETVEPKAPAVMHPRIVVLEDDVLQTENLREMLQKRLRLSPGQILVWSAESDFRKWLLMDESQSVVSSAVFVLDMMVRWSRVQPVIPDMPNDVRLEGFRRAGLRCANLLKERCQNARVVLHTILDEDDLVDIDLQGFGVVTKTHDTEPLMRWIASALNQTTV